MTVAFSISADGGKVGKQVIICKSKKKKKKSALL